MKNLFIMVFLKTQCLAQSFFLCLKVKFSIFVSRVPRLHLSMTKHGVTLQVTSLMLSVIWIMIWSSCDFGFINKGSHIDSILSWLDHTLYLNSNLLSTIRSFYQLRKISSYSILIFNMAYVVGVVHIFKKFDPFYWLRYLCYGFFFLLIQDI